MDFELNSTFIIQNSKLPSSHPVGDPEASPGIAPAGKGVAVADDVAAAAFQAAVMHEGHLLLLLRPAIATGRTGVDAAAIVAAAADRGIENDMGLPIDGEAGVVENFIYVHNALQAVKASEMAFFRPTFFFTSRRMSLGMFIFGVPSMR